MKKVYPRLRAKSVLGGFNRQQPHGPGQGEQQRSVLVDGNGGPLSVAVAGVNIHDTKLLELTRECVVVERPDGGDAGAQHLWLEKGYDTPTGRRAVAAHENQGHIWRIGK